MKPTILLFLKAPRAGLVKTRLAEEIGPAAAAAVYRQLAEDQWRRIPSDWAVEVHYAPADAEPEMRAWLGTRGVFRAQPEGDLGTRIAAGFAAAFDAGGGPVLAIGGDCPELDQACLEAAWAGLHEADVVLGPATDGGYYLIGLRRPAPELFRDIPWSSPQVLRATCARAEAAALRCHLLPAKDDVDDAAGWARHQARIAAIAPTAPPCPRATSRPGNVTVIVPTLNEAARIEDTVRTTLAALPGARVIVVDGGSADATATCARRAGAEVVFSAPGRGVQLAAGARIADSEWLLFLHADTALPENAAAVIADFTRDRRARVATFRLRFDDPGLFLRACCWFTRFDSVFTRFGDQGILIRRDFYASLGGFPAWPLFEDVALLQRARRIARVGSLPATVTTSARRFERCGHVRQQWLNARLLLRYLAGTPPARLAELYRRAVRRTGPAAALPAGALNQVQRSKS